MKNLLVLCCVLLFSQAVFAQTDADDARLRLQVGAFIDAWHDDAAHAREAYFDKMAPDGVYIGTDKTELWSRDAFKAWARPFFERKAAWAFKSTKRNIYLSDDHKIIWFDELLDTQMGVCRASGVIRNTQQGLQIAHYQLSIAVPNEVGKQVSASIHEFETRAVAKWIELGPNELDLLVELGEKLGLLIGVFLLVAAISAILSGWFFLARRYGAKHKPRGASFHNCVTRIGLVSEGRMTTMIVAHDGLYLRRIWIQRFMHAPLMVPWRELVLVRQGRYLFWQVFVLRTSSGLEIVVKQRAYEAMRAYLP